jgi:hypothetical protein
MIVNEFAKMVVAVEPSDIAKYKGVMKFNFQLAILEEQSNKINYCKLKVNVQNKGQSKSQLGLLNFNGHQA